MEYRILGNFEVWNDGREVPLGAQKQRALLAVLVLNANELVSVDRLVDELWGEQPPVSAAKVVQVYVSQLRKALGSEGREAIVTRPSGYVVQLEPERLDAYRFERLLAAAAVEDGIIGSFGFDSNGDTTAASIAILRVDGVGPGLSPLSEDFLDGATVDRVIAPDLRLVRE